jgi:hypothetical protein
MKMIREVVDAVVMFGRNGVSPIMITCSHGNIRVIRVIRMWKERRNLKECHIYLCSVEGREDPMELRWEIESNRWFMEKY